VSSQGSSLFSRRDRWVSRCLERDCTAGRTSRLNNKRVIIRETRQSSDEFPRKCPRPLLGNKTYPIRRMFTSGVPWFKSALLDTMVGLLHRERWPSHKFF
jgi:hypothetical protein